MAPEEKRLDKIHIRDLLIRCIVGFNQEERDAKQDVIVNIVLYTDLYTAGRTDRLEDTVNYRTVKKEVMAMVEASRYRSVEALAEAVARTCLAEPRVDRVDVTLDKPGALRFARSVAVEISRTREG